MRFCLAETRINGYHNALRIVELCINPLAGVRTDREMNFENEYKNDCSIAVANHIV